MDIVTIDGEDKPHIIFKPYIWAVVEDHYNCIAFKREINGSRQIEIFMKEGYYNGNKRKQAIKY